MVPTPDSPEWQDPANRNRDETPFYTADMIEYTGNWWARLWPKSMLWAFPRLLIIFYSDNGTVTEFHLLSAVSGSGR